MIVCLMKKPKIVRTINIQNIGDATTVVAKARLFFDWTTKIELYDMERQSVEAKKILEVAHLQIELDPKWKKKKKK